MISSEQEVTARPENRRTAPDGPQVVLSQEAYDTIMQATSGEATGLLLGDPAGGDTQEIVVRRVARFTPADDGMGFVLDREAIENITEVTSTGASFHLLGWYCADPVLLAFRSRVPIAEVQALMPARSNLFALVNPATNRGTFFTWDGAYYHEAGTSGMWESALINAEHALDGLLANEPPKTAPIPIQADPAPPPQERTTAPIPIGAQAVGVRTDDTAPLPAFLRRKYNLELLRLKSSWPEWTRQMRATPGYAVSALRHNTAVLFRSQSSKRAALVALGALLSIAVGATLMMAGLNSAPPSQQQSATPTAALPIVVTQPSPSATLPAVAIATTTPSATATIEDTATPMVADTATPTQPPPVPTDTPLPPPPPPTEEIVPTDTP
ncbi:MAG TPA: hypothetical protein VLQ48_12220, partial [Chloroflexia bacterium]|nr:hypothetical protein [Chloroflexia bacterium]